MKAKILTKEEKNKVKGKLLQEGWTLNAIAEAQETSKQNVNNAYKGTSNSDNAVAIRETIISIINYNPWK